MKARLPLALLLLTSVVGTAYSGYLTYITYSSGRSACEAFYFGFPSCFYGFLIYSVVFTLSLASLLMWKTARAAAAVVLGAAGVGFSAFLTGYVVSLNACVNLSILGIPPCAMGLGMFTVVLVIAGSLFRSADH
ncbi:MAG TPA: hypothetical protein VJR06_10055 [Nitrososphaerales archaeon]|nr:hypothetical protein [Nitrososphaerales archaeon]